MKGPGFRPASLLAASVAFALISGCAQMPGQAGGMGSTAAEGGSPLCSPTLGGATGALGGAGGALASTAGEAIGADMGVPMLGGAIGALAGSMFGKGKGHLAGAVIGAGIGVFACMAYNYHSRKVRDAKAVEAQYAHERRKLPANNTVASYQSELSPNGTVKSGTSAEMQSTITVLKGTHDTAPKLKEELTLYSPDGKALSTVTKEAAAINDTGEYQTNFDFDLPKGIQEGRYTMRSTLYMDDKQVRTNQVPMLVVS